jgi:Integrase zinc binding domain
MLKQCKFVICIPNELMPSVIHTLHQTLGHPTVSTTLKNFQHYYYHHKAKPLIRDYVQACLKCKYAHKQDLKKSVPSAERTLQPTRPRQHLYCDLIPMPKGQYSYILFSLEAYCQYVYTLPLKDKTAPSVLQGFLSLFATTGWYEALYLDNETSFQKAAKTLVKFAPIAVHYSTPYCHFQNNEDWPLLLPTVTQALNRKIILSLGLSRDSLHYNRQSEFFPLAHLADDESNKLDSIFDSLALNVYDHIKKQRDKWLKSRRGIVPTYQPNQIEFLVDQTPSPAGVSSVLKTPNVGPYRIDCIEEKNVSLTELQTDKQVHSHIELIRPVEPPELQNPAANIPDMEPYNFADPVSDPAPHEDAETDPGLELHYVADPDSESSAQANSSHHLYGDIEDEFFNFTLFASLRM